MESPPIPVSSPAASCPFQHLLQQKTNLHTRRAYQTDIRAFLTTWSGVEPDESVVLEFVRLPEEKLRFHLAMYKSNGLAEGTAPATVNRRLAAMKALVQSAFHLGLTSVSADGLIKSETISRVASRPSLQPVHIAAILRQPDKSTPRGLRDHVLLNVLLHGALKSAEIRAMRVSSVSEDGTSLLIPGRPTGKHSVNLGAVLAAELRDYMTTVGIADRPEAWLFPALHSASDGAPLSGDGLYKIVREYARSAGVPTEVGPGDLRKCALIAMQGAVVKRRSRISYAVTA